MLAMELFDEVIQEVDLQCHSRQSVVDVVIHDLYFMVQNKLPQEKSLKDSNGTGKTQNV
jgi:hypothetical protein